MVSGHVVEDLSTDLTGSIARIISGTRWLGQTTNGRTGGSSIDQTRVA